jgi:hypothetical protein
LATPVEMSQTCSAQLVEIPLMCMLVPPERLSMSSMVSSDVGAGIGSEVGVSPPLRLVVGVDTGVVVGVNAGEIDGMGDCSPTVYVALMRTRQTAAVVVSKCEPYHAPPAPSLL